jgi:L-threonylcarbamoyladenylate synthase
LSKIRFIDPLGPDPVLIREAIHRLDRGGMVVLPTRHLYGLGVDALNPRAVERVFTAKQRPRQQPLLILVASSAEAGIYARGIDARATALMHAFWPGKLTIVLPAGPLLPEALMGGTGRIGIRLVAHPVSRHLVRALGRPITASSANLSGQPGCRRIEDLQPAILAAADLVLDAGPLLPGIGSTVVDVQPDVVRILREGAVKVDAIRTIIDGPVAGP